MYILAWGKDCNNVGYRISYTTATDYTNTGESLDVLSRSKDGVDMRTLAKIRLFFAQKHNENITALVRTLKPVLLDGGREGQPPLEECDAHCRTNEELIEHLIGPKAT